MPDCITFRFDENLLGRIMVAKIKGTDGLSLENKPPLHVQSTVLPDVQFDSFTEWKKYVHEQNAMNERMKIENQESREKIENSIVYYKQWLNDKFSKVT